MKFKKLINKHLSYNILKYIHILSSGLFILNKLLFLSKNESFTFTLTLANLYLFITSGFNISQIPLYQ